MVTKKVLVVEDEQALANAIAHKLKQNGLEVMNARSFEEAHERIQRTIPDLIWLDHYLLGKTNGLDLLQFLKEHEEYAHIPVFVVSNTAGPDKRQTYLEMGVERYFVKSGHDLKEIVAELCDFLAGETGGEVCKDPTI